MKVELMSVGTELLLGDILNTNAQYLSQALAAMGFTVRRQTTIGDNKARFLSAIDYAFKDNDMIITTGGLGPTEDDLTKETVFEYFGMESVEHEGSVKHLEKFFKRVGRPMVASNLKQALFPREAIVLENDNGTAPGCIVEKNGKVVIVLPGPPREMVPMFDNKVVPYLAKYQDGVIVSRTLKVIGVGESLMEEKVLDLIKNENPTAAPYAKTGECQLRITAKASDADKAREMIVPVQKEVISRLGDNVYGFDSDTLESVTADLLIKKNMTIAVAESCTGGALTAKLVNCSGISKVLLQGVVAYSNESKIERLGVNPATLEKFGAVSEETAREMAEGIAKSSNSRVGIATTGIAGPDGGTPEKPVGLVYLGLYIDGNVTVKKCNYAGKRNYIRDRAVLDSLDMIRRALLR